MGDGDGWVWCAAGHRHWGRYGAAGLLVADGERTVLQHRAPWTHEGGTWGLPGGARDSHEDPVTTALREAREEAAIAPAAVWPRAMSVDDHGGWSYTTVLATPQGAICPHAANAESTQIRWWPDERVDALPLHHGLAAAWPALRRVPPPLRLVVDAANVVGARPDGWWRDRPAATRRLLARLGDLARDGIAARSLPEAIDAGGLGFLLPQLAVVVEGAARAAACDRPRPDPSWWRAAVTVHPAPADGDTEIVEQAGTALGDGAQTVVVTADRGLRARLAPGVIAAGPSWLLGLLGG